MSSANFDQLEAQLRTLGENKGVLSISKKQAIRDRVFQSIGQIELADAIASGETKAELAVSLKHLQKALIPHRLSFSMPATIAVVVMVFMGSIVTGAVAQSSNPGDILFNVRKVLETIEMAVISNPVKKAELSLNIADERIKYLEASVGREEALHTILQESQSALVSARETLKKAGESGDAASAAALLEKFNNLLADQKTILEDIEQTAPSDDIKQTIVAIRDEIAAGQTEDNQTDKIIETDDKTVAVVNPKVVKTTPTSITSSNQPPVIAVSLTGFQTLAGRIGTASGQPAIFFGGNQYIVVISSPVALDQYIGASNVALSGTVKDGYITVLRLVINGVVLADIIPQTIPVSTGGEAENLNNPE